MAFNITMLGQPRPDLITKKERKVKLLDHRAYKSNRPKKNNNTEGLKMVNLMVKSLPLGLMTR